MHAVINEFESGSEPSDLPSIDEDENISLAMVKLMVKLILHGILCTNTCPNKRKGREYRLKNYHL